MALVGSLDQPGRLSRKASANAGGGSGNGPPERQRAMVAGHRVGAPMVDRLDPGGEQPFSSIRSPAPPTRRTSTPTGSPSPGSCASPAAPPAIRRTYPEDWDDVLAHVLAESTEKINRSRRHRSYPCSQARPPQQLPRPVVKDARLRTPCDRAPPARLQVIGAAARHPSSAASNASTADHWPGDALRHPDRVSTIANN